MSVERDGLWGCAYVMGGDEEVTEDEGVTIGARREVNMVGIRTGSTEYTADAVKSDEGQVLSLLWTTMGMRWALCEMVRSALGSSHTRRRARLIHPNSHAFYTQNIPICT